MTVAWPHRFFKATELASPDRLDSGLLMQLHFMTLLDALRGLMKRPFRINSGFRTASHNKKVGGAARSAHLFGRAADIDTVGWTAEERLQLISFARSIGLTGIGISGSFIHVDDMPRVATWVYRHGKAVSVPVGTEADWV